MIFGEIPVDEAEGAILAHAVQAGGRRLKKGRVLSAEDVLALREAGLTRVIAARLAPGDLGEDVAAGRLAAAIRTRGIRLGPAATGRVNLYAEKAGIFTVDAALVDAVNAVDPSLTVATLKPFSTVDAGQMVATVKIIPFAMDGATAERAASLASVREICAVHPFRPMTAGVVQTELPTLKPSVLDKTRQITDSRLALGGGRIADEIRVPHSVAPLAKAVSDLAGRCDLVLVFGASAVVDPNDVVPAAIRSAGGNVSHVGMPVDPGNLLVMGEIGGTPVIGAPGCEEPGSA